ncbi:hypothetical protein ACJZ2D_006343 [Fusarium nematophilum]
MPVHRIRPRGRQRQCAYCDRVFTKEEHLRRHQRSHTGERPFKCDKCGRSYARSDVLFRHLQTHHSDKVDGHRSTTTREGEPQNDRIRHTSKVIIARPRDSPPAEEEISVVDPEQPAVSRTECAPVNHHPLLPRPFLSSITSPMPANFPPASIHQDSTDPDTAAMDLERDNSQDGNAMNEYSFEDGGCLDELADFLLQGSPPSPPQQVMHNQTMSETQDSERYRQESIVDHLPFDIFQMFGPQLYAEQPSEFQLGQDIQQDQFLEVFDLLGHSPHDDLRLGPNLGDPVDCENASKPSLPSRSSISVADTASTNTPMAVSEAQVQLIGRLWSRQKPKPASRLIRRLWKQVILHEADNIFTNPQGSSHSDPDSRMSQSRVNEEVRARLVRYCKELDDSIPDGSQSAPRPFSQRSRDVSGSSVPALEILDSSLDFFFHFFHPILPFMHRGTFDASNTPSPLLLAMCLVGLSYLDRMGTRAFVIPNLKKLMRSCLSHMTSQALTESAPSGLLATLASTLIVVYLALGFRDEVDECQAYTLCAQMLTITDKQGLFAASQGDDPVLQLRQGPSDPDAFWKAWARVESIKRQVSSTIALTELTICSLIFSFVCLDMAYARLMNTAGVIEIDKMELHLPCEDSLFNGSTSASFLHAVQLGARLTMPCMSIQNLHTTSAPSLNDTSAQLVLRALFLKMIAARTRLSDGDSQFSEPHPVSPAEALSTDTSFKDIVTNVVRLPTTHAVVLQSKNRNNALGWNYLCITLTADLDLLETASGRDGLEAASAALVHVAKWSRSACARRAVLHAAQVFDILDSSRIRESHLTRPDLVLFVSALVISQYVLVSSQEAYLDTPPFELLQNIDWTVVKNEGLADTGEPIDRQRQSTPSNEARHFIHYGGPISFAGEVQNCGGIAARKIVRKFAHLMDGLGMRGESDYSQLLKMMCDTMIKSQRDYPGSATYTTV